MNTAATTVIARLRRPRSIAAMTLALSLSGVLVWHTVFDTGAGVPPSPHVLAVLGLGAGDDSDGITAPPTASAPATAAAEAAQAQASAAGAARRGTRGGSAGGVAGSGSASGSGTNRGVSAVSGTGHRPAVPSFGQKFWGWGYNQNGEPGTGSYTCSGSGNYATCATTSISWPTGATSGNGITAIAAGTNHALAIGNNNDVYGWGSDGSDRLGMGSGHSASYSTPTAIPGTGGTGNLQAIAVAASFSHSLVVTTNGNVWSAGTNGSGELGIGSTISGSTWNHVCSTSGCSSGYLTNIVAVAAPAYVNGYGAPQSMALDSSGHVYTWGDNLYGEIGNGSTGGGSCSCVDLPYQVSISKTIVAITSGMYSDMALASDGTVYTWGYNHYGVIGNGTQDGGTCDCVASPTQVWGTGGSGTTLSDIIQVATNGYTAMALDYNGNVYTWGSYWYAAQTETAQSGVCNCIASLYPQPALESLGGAALTGVGSIALGPYDAYAIRTDGSLWGWDADGCSEFGDLTTPGICGSGGTQWFPKAVQASNGLKQLNDVVQGGAGFIVAGQVFGRPIGGTIPAMARAGGGTFCWKCFVKQFAEGHSGNYPINTATGEFYHTFMDFDLPSRGGGVTFAHTYSSTVAENQVNNGLTPGPLGHGWSGSAGVSLTWNPATAANTITVIFETGAQLNFYPTTSTTWTAGSAFNATISCASNVLTLVRNSTDYMTFNVSSCSPSAQLTASIASEVDPNGDGVAYTYNGSGQLTGMVDENSNVADTSGQARTLTLAYCTSTGSGCVNGNLEAVTDGIRTVTFKYDTTNNDLIEVDDSTRKTYFTYSNHLLTKMTMPDNTGTYDHIITNTYDSLGRVTEQSVGLNNTPTYQTTDYVYTGINGMPSTTTLIKEPFNTGDTSNQGSSIGRAEVLETYTAGLRTSVEKGYGCGSTCSADQTWSYQYDPVTLVPDQITAPNHSSGCYVTTMTDDSNGNVTSVSDPLCNVTSTTYDTKFNLVTSTTDGNLNAYNTAHSTQGYSETYWYDSSGNLVRTCATVNAAVAECPYAQTTAGTMTNEPPASSTSLRITDYVYGDPSHPGDVTAVTDPDGYVSQTVYDAQGDVVATVDPLGDKTTMAYDSVGRLVSETSPRGNAQGALPSRYTTTTTYDVWGDPLTVTDPMHHTTTSTYDGDGNLTSLKDGDGNTTSYTYDGADEQTKITRQDTSTLETAFNADGTMQSQTDGAGNTTTYGYDPQDRLVYTTTPSGASSTISYTYDADGNLSSTGNTADNASATYSYNVGDQLTGITYGSTGTTTPAVSNINYDADGERTSMTDGIGSGSESWTYDNAGDMTSSSDGNGATICYGYDLKGQMTQVVYEPGTNCASSPASTYHTVSQTFDPAGRMTAVEDWSGNTTSFAYDPDSNLVATTFPAGSNSVVDSVVYDQADELTAMSDTKNGTAFAAFSFTRDANDQVLADQQSINGATPTTNSYTYNSLNKLTGQGSTSYAFDSADNLTTNRGTTQSFNSANELVYSGSSTTACNSSPGSGATSYCYDNRGERTAMTPSTLSNQQAYAYDQAGRLITYQKGNPLTTQATYTYNGDGLRLKKVAGGTTTLYAWDVADSLPLVLLDGPSGSQASYIYGPGGLPIELITSGGTAYWVHHDQLGSTRALTDSSGSTQYAPTFTYDAYGKVTACTNTTVPGITCTGSVNIAFPLQYAGQYTDSESGLQYLRARYYDPTTAQFLTRDPMAAETRAPYAYAAGAPTNLVDPTGNDPWWQDEPPQANIGCGVLQGSGDCPPIPIPGGGTVAKGAAEIAGWILGLIGIVCSEGSADGESNPDAGNIAQRAHPDFNDPSKSPGEDWVWRGQPPKGGDKGAWYDPKTGESLHPDMNHPAPLGPHWDYDDPSGRQFRWFPDGSIVPKDSLPGMLGEQGGIP